MLPLPALSTLQRTALLILLGVLLLSAVALGVICTGRGKQRRRQRSVNGMRALLLTFALAISGCASKSPLVVQPRPIHLEARPPRLGPKRSDPVRKPRS